MSLFYSHGQLFMLNHSHYPGLFLSLSTLLFTASSSAEQYWSDTSLTYLNGNQYEMAETIEHVAFAAEQQSNATADMSSSAKDLKAVSEQESEFVKNNDEKTRQLAEDAERLRHQIEKFAV